MKLHGRLREVDAAPERPRHAHVFEPNTYGAGDEDPGLAAHHADVGQVDLAGPERDGWQAGAADGGGRTDHRHRAAAHPRPNLMAGPRADTASRRRGMRRARRREPP